MMRRLVLWAAVVCGALLYGSLVSHNWPLRMENSFVLYGQSGVIPPPVLGTLSPPNGMMGSTVSMVFSGANLASGAALYVNDDPLGPSTQVLNVDVVSSTILTADFVIPARGSPRTVTVGISVRGQNAVINLPFEITRGPTCAVTLNGSTYSNGQTVIADGLVITNPAAAGVPVEFKYWIGQPGGSALNFAGGGQDGSIILQPGMVQNIGPLTLGTVQPEYPRGFYTFVCKFINPIPGNVLTQDTKVFNLQ